MSDRQATPGELVFATRNAGKVAELTALLDGSGWAARLLPEDFPEYEETGATFADNARGKALFASAHLPDFVLADDSGLEIDALGGEPGVRSARYIDASISQEERNRAVLELLAGKPIEQRTGRFVCHLALAHGGELVHETIGTCAGIIGAAPRGGGGFGYDPIFVVPELGLTFAEISREQKAARSHRGAAMRAMSRFLRDWDPP